MKNFSAFLLMTVFSVGASAAPKLVWDCQSESDPDHVDARIYESKGHLFAAISMEFGDGDGFEEDVIELQQVDNGNDSMLTYEQINNPSVKLPKLVKGATGLTRDVRIVIPFLGGEGSIDTETGPNGDWAKDAFVCTRP